MINPDAVETMEFAIEADGERDTVTVPRGLVDLLTEDGDRGASRAPVVAGDIVLLSCAQRVHAVVTHSEGEVTDELLAIEARTMALFEDRFGRTFEEATGLGRETAG